MSTRPVETCRTWLFVEGANSAALQSAPASGADVLIQELEDFTPPALRPRARELAPTILAAWKNAGALAAVRVNPLDGDGEADLAAAMHGAPDLVLLPKSDWPAQIERLDAAITVHERALGIAEGSTGIVPNIELALGLRNTYDIARASPRVAACLVASEDMAADLGAERSRDGRELDYVRARFHAECVAAGVLSVDCPYTWSDVEGLEADAHHARRLGYRAKSAVHAAHVAVIERVLVPSPEQAARARRVVDAFERAREAGEARVELDGSLVEVPIYLNARRLLSRMPGADRS